MEIKDAIYRGREDFVYRITVGELPLVTGIFPLGGRDGTPTTVDLSGCNLPAKQLTLGAEAQGPGVRPISVRKDGQVSNGVPFAVDTLPECLEQEPNNEPKTAHRIAATQIVNGRIDRPGDWDVFRIEGRAGTKIVAEVQARRLGSPLDSVLKLTDAAGRQLAANDDHEDKAAGLVTHHADSRLDLTVPADGICYVYLGDAQQKGSAAHAYRLRIGAPRPDFALRVAPASVNARPGTTVPITVYALRRDGFSGDIAIALKDPPRGFTLGGGWAPAGHDEVRLTLTVPPAALDDPVKLRMEGRAEIDGREVRHEAVPAEDMMQAFAYRHLVPAQQWLASVVGPGRLRPGVRLIDEAPVKLPVGGTATVRYSVPKGPLLDDVELELSDPPPGVAIQDVSVVPEGVAVLLRAESGKVKPGAKGNLIVEAFLERTVGPAGGQRRRIPLGTLPAVAFEVVQP
jgi:hypothetical protein